MNRNQKHIVPLLVLILVLAGVLYALYARQSLPFFSSDEEIQDATPPDSSPDTAPDAEDEPPAVDQPDADEPTEPTEPTEPVGPSEPQESEPTGPIVELEGSVYTYIQMKEDLVALAARYPALMQLSVYGTSVDGRELYVAKLGNAQADKQIIITSGMHAREYVACYVIMRQIEYYLSNYETATYRDTTVRQLLSEVCLVIAPMTNPDGITVAQEGIDSLNTASVREGLESIVRSIIGNGDVDAYLNREWKTNVHGVDINRNFDALWAIHTDGVGRPTAKNYKGERPNSEPETAALVRLTESLSNPVASLCMHMQGEVIYWRCNQQGEFMQENRRLAELAASVTGYRIIDTQETEPSYSNWTILAHRIPTITVEMGVSRYPLSYDMADGMLQKNLELWAAVAYEYCTD